MIAAVFIAAVCLCSAQDLSSSEECIQAGQDLGDCVTQLANAQVSLFKTAK